MLNTKKIEICQINSVQCSLEMVVLSSEKQRRRLHFLQSVFKYPFL